MIVVDKHGNFIKIDPNYTGITETPDGCIVSYKIIEEENGST